MKKTRALALISGGIDSPVASHALKQYDQEAVYFDNFPFSGEDTKNRALKAMRALGFKKAYIVPHGLNLAEFSKNCGRKYQCVLCRRMMFRAASMLAKEKGFSFLITGENLGQVASQTLRNIHTESQAATIPVVRPLIGYDKNEIITIAKKIGTYKISITPAACCSIVPPKPATSAKLDKVLQEEAKVNITELTEKSIRNAQELIL